MTTVRIPVADGEAYWTLPASLGRTYEAIPDPYQAEFQDILSDVVRRFLLGLSGLVSSGDIQGVQLLDDAIRVQVEAAYGRALRGRQP